MSAVAHQLGGGQANRVNSRHAKSEKRPSNALPLEECAEMVDARFWALVIKRRSGCWVWNGMKRNGYGRVTRGGRRYSAHRLAYSALVGPIPEGHTIDHLCRNRACVNPVHLEPVTNRENILRGSGATAANARKTHCKRGHPLSGDNLFLEPKGRACRTCRNAHRAATRERARQRKREAKA